MSEQMTPPTRQQLIDRVASTFKVKGGEDEVWAAAKKGLEGVLVHWWGHYTDERAPADPLLCIRDILAHGWVKYCEEKNKERK